MSLRTKFNGIHWKVALLIIVAAAMSARIALTFYSQYRHVDVYVSQRAPMPSDLGSKPHMAGHDIDPVVTIETPYDKAEIKVLSLSELKEVRDALAWHPSNPVLVRVLSIQSPILVIGRCREGRLDGQGM